MKHPRIGAKSLKTDMGAGVFWPVSGPVACAVGAPEALEEVLADVSWFRPTDFTTMDAQANQTECSNPDVHNTADSPESIWLGEAVATSSKAKQTSLPTYVATAKTLPPWYSAHGDSDCQVTTGTTPRHAVRPQRRR